MTMAGASVKKAYHIDLKVHNNSDFPIVQLDVVPGGIKEGGKRTSLKLCAIEERLANPIYIAENSFKCIRLIVPSDIIKKLGVEELPIQLFFTNVVDMTTQTKLHITIDLAKSRVDRVVFSHKFRIAKIMDVFEQ